MTTVDAMSEGVVKDTELLSVAVRDLDAKLVQWNLRKNDRSLDPFAKPLAALMANSRNAKDASLTALKQAYAIAGDKLTNQFCDVAIKFYAALSVSLETVDLAEPIAAFTRLSDLTKVTYLKAAFPEEVWSGAETACAMWQTTSEAYLAALKEERDKANPPASQYRTRSQRGGGGGTPRLGGRGGGKWQEEHGWRFDATCDNCGNHVTSGSAIGSFQNDMAKHWPSCRGDNGGRIKLEDGSIVERVMWRDSIPEFAAAHDGFSGAMYAVRDSSDPDVVAEGGGFTIRRDYVGQAAA